MMGDPEQEGCQSRSGAASSRTHREMRQIDGRARQVSARASGEPDLWTLNDVRIVARGQDGHTASTA